MRSEQRPESANESLRREEYDPFDPTSMQLSNNSVATNMAGPVPTTAPPTTDMPFGPQKPWWSSCVSVACV